MTVLPTNRSENAESYQQVLDTARRLMIDNQVLSARLHHMQQIVAALNRVSTREAALTILKEQIGWLFKFDHCSAVLLNPEGGWSLNLLIETAAPSGNNNQSSPQLSLLPLPADLQGAATNALKGYTSQMIIPLESEHEILGTINFGCATPDAFSLEDRRTGSLLAAQLANGLRQIQLLEENQRARQETEQYIAKIEAGAAGADEFSYTVAHDLKSPLNLLLGYVGLLRIVLDDNQNEEVQSYIREVEMASKNMARIIDQLLWLAQLDNARDVAIPVNMVAIAKRSLWRFHRDIDNQQIQIEIDPEMPSALGQEGWIEEVFANLIGNAIKYMGDNNQHPEIHIHGSRISGTQMARYEVRDNGIGITAADQERVFQMFSRLHLTSADGHGLGLSIVSRIIERLGGEVGLDSVFGSGSTFWFTLPAAPSLE